MVVINISMINLKFKITSTPTPTSTYFIEVMVSNVLMKMSEQAFKFIFRMMMFTKLIKYIGLNFYLYINSHLSNF